MIAVIKYPQNPKEIITQSRIVPAFLGEFTCAGFDSCWEQNERNPLFKPEQLITLLFVYRKIECYTVIILGRMSVTELLPKKKKNYQHMHYIFMYLQHQFSYNYSDFYTPAPWGWWYHFFSCRVYMREQPRQPRDKVLSWVFAGWEI